MSNVAAHLDFADSARVDRLNLLAVALGLAALAGINLYLTVFVTGLAVHFHWITLLPQYQSLEVLGNPWIIIVAGVLYLLEFLADKIPWVDSIWDAVHTVIRPIGGALLAIQVLGQSSPTMTVLVALFAGGTSLVSHTAKAATRLTSNTSPEPFSNIALSLGEDVAVLGGLVLIYNNPLIALSIFAVAILAFFYFAPKILRAMKVKLWLAWKKLNGPADVDLAAKLPNELPGRVAEEFMRQNVLAETTAWVVPCTTGRCRGMAANVPGMLIATNEDPKKLIFIPQKRRRPFSKTIELARTSVAREPKFLSENLNITEADAKSPSYTFVFPRSDVALVKQIADDLRVRISTPIWPLEQKHLEEVATT
jgi:uncharacterized membrane protein